MIKKWAHSIIAGNDFLSIEVVLSENGKKYRAIEVSKKGDSLTIGDTYECSSLEELLEKIPKSRPTLLSFTGQGIISKKIENTGNYRAKLLFNANFDDFYWYELLQPNFVYASVVRKKVVDDELSTLRDKGVMVLDISIGPLVMSVLKPLLPNRPDIVSEHYKLVFAEDKLHEISKTQNDIIALDYDIDGEKIQSRNILPFSNLLNYLYPNPDIESNKSFLRTNREDFKYRKAFNTAGMIALPTFLLGLLVSYFLIGHFQREYLELKVELGEKNIAHSKLIELEADRNNKERILMESGLNNSNFLSYYTSEITKNIPGDVSIHELQLFRPSEKIKPGQRITFDNDLIEIQGTAHSNRSFTGWIEDIKKSNWLAGLEIVDFRNEGGINHYIIRLKLLINV